MKFEMSIQKFNVIVLEERKLKKKKSIKNQNERFK